VAEVENKVIGFCMGTTISKSAEAGSYGYITWIGVQAKYRRRGVGTLLFNEIVNRMKKSGAAMLFVDIDVDNKAAASFFTKLGFGDVKKHLYMDLNLAKSKKSK
jgi:ribosomal protein S18 acetylase RimI-like enzyme